MTVRMRVFAMLVLVIFGGDVPAVRSAPELVPLAPDIEVFMREGCPACSAAKRFFDDFQRERSALRIIYSDPARSPGSWGWQSW
jgi:hypothetical protein